MLSLNLTLLIQMALILAFAGLMNVLFFRPVTQVLEERQAYVAKAHAEAHQDLKRIQTLQEDYEARLKAARVEAQEAIQAAVRDAEQKRGALMGEAKEAVDRKISEARAAITAERDQAIAELGGDVSALATLMTRKLGVEPAVTGARGGEA